MLAIYQMTGVTTFYGPALVASFGEFAPYDEMTFKYFADIFMKDQNLPYEFKKPAFWTKENLDWEKQTRSKNRIENNWITCNRGVAKGRLIIGNFNDQGTQKLPYQILKEVIGDYNFPFIADVDCGHTHPMFTMPIGAAIELNASEQTITLLSPKAKTSSIPSDKT